MKIHFTKMHGCGNDYIFIDRTDEAGELPNPRRLAAAMSPRHFSVGGDGVVIISKSHGADAAMRIFNADGSEGRMCGNALRCVGLYLYARGICERKSMTVDTPAGRRPLEILSFDGRCGTVRVQMGKASFDPRDITPLGCGAPLIDAPVPLFGENIRMTAVSVGNPHWVTFVDETERLDISAAGSSLEAHPMLKERINTEFVKVIDPKNIQMRVWERGSGETLACGTGACAAVAVCVRLKKCARGLPVNVRLPGGVLTVCCGEDGEITLSGGAAFVYDGVFDFADERGGGDHFGH